MARFVDRRLALNMFDEPWIGMQTCMAGIIHISRWVGTWVSDLAQRSTCTGSMDWHTSVG